MSLPSFNNGVIYIQLTEKKPENIFANTLIHCCQIIEKKAVLTDGESRILSF